MLFSTPMVQAILDGRKTQTRRVLKPQVRACSHQDYTEAEWKNSPTEWTVKEGYAYCGLCGNGIEYSKNFSGIKCPYGQPGDRIWVREKWKPNDILMGWPYHYYAANDTFTHPDNEKWKPPIFMPKAAARIWLEVVDVRVERLQDINENDAVSEGVEQNPDGSWRDYIAPARLWQDAAKPSFQSLWQFINGVESWEANPWVWVVEFKRIEP